MGRLRNRGKVGLVGVGAMVFLFLSWRVWIEAPGEGATLGQELPPVQIRDADDRPAQIPGFGVRLIGVFYNDADVADMNDPLADAIDARGFDKEKYEGLGIGNLKDSKLPNFIIRQIIKRKVEKYHAVILIDPDRMLARAWDLGDCNNTAVFILIGKDRRVKYVYKGAVRGEEISKVVRMIEDLIR